MTSDYGSGWHAPTPEGTAGTLQALRHSTADPSTSAPPGSADQDRRRWILPPADRTGHDEIADLILGEPRPGIIPLRPLSTGELLGGAFDALRTSPRAMFLPSLVVMGTVSLLDSALAYLHSTSPGAISTDILVTDADETQDVALAELNAASALQELWLRMPTYLLTCLAATTLVGLLIVAVSHTVLGHSVTPGQAWAHTRGRVWALIGQSALIMTAITTCALAVGAVGTLGLVASTSLGRSSTAVTMVSALGAAAVVLVTALLVTALGARLFLAPAALILENVSVARSLRRSWELTRGSVWRVLGTLVLTLVIGLLVASTAGLVLVTLSGLMILLTGIQVSNILDLVNPLMDTLLGVITLPFGAAVVALTYTDLRMRTEGLDVELRRFTGA